jgi:hypothetical protein
MTRPASFAKKASQRGLASKPSMKHYTWLSFCDPSRKPGTAFLGAAVVEASSHDSAIILAWAKGCNPGGEVLSHGFTSARFPDKYLDRLLTRQECDTLERERGSFL